MAKTESPPPLAATDGLSRRSFLAAGAVFLGGTLPAIYAHAQEPQTGPQLKADARAVLLTEMENVIDQGGEVEARVAQIPQVAKLVKQYRDALTNASDLSAEELSRATRIVQLKINMTHFSSGIPQQEAEQFINSCALEFYRDLHTHLIALKKSQPDKASGIDSSLSTIQGDIYWSASHCIPGISRECGELVSDLYIKPESCTCISQIEQQMHFNHDHHAFYLAVLNRCQECLPRVLNATIEKITSGAEEYPQPKAESLLRFASHARSTIAGSRKCDLLPESQAVILNERFSKDFERPLFNKLIPIFAATIRKDKAEPTSGATQFIDFGAFLPPLPIRTNAPPPLTALMIKFISAMDGSRVELGNQFMKSYQAEVSRPEFNRSRRFELIPLLAHLAPEPELKEPLTSDLRALLLRDRAALNDPKTLSAYLGALLVSDHLYGASIENKTLNLVSASRISCSLMKQSDDARRLVPAITPSEALLIDLMRAANDAQAVDRLIGSDNIPADQRQTLSELADKTALNLALDIYKLTPAEAYRPKSDHYPELVSIPEHWGPEAVHFNEPDRGAEFLASLQSLARLADGITASYCRFEFRASDEGDLVERMLVISRLFEERESVRGIGGESIADPLEQLRNTFPYLSERSVTGPFSQVLQKSRNMLYQARHGRPAPVIPREEDPRIRTLRDEKLEVLARDYARAAEEHFICSYAIRIWHSDDSRTARPLESHQSLSSSRMAREISLLLNEFGFSGNHDGLRILFENLVSPKDAKNAKKEDSDGNAKLLDEVKRHRETVAAKRDRLIGQINEIVSK